MPGTASTAAVGLREKVPTRMGNSPTKPFRPGTAADPSDDRMKKKASSGSRSHKPPSSAISRV